MFSRLRRVRSHLVVLTALAILAGVVAPLGVRAQAAPTVVSVSVSGNVHVPTDRILAVVARSQVGDQVEHLSFPEYLSRRPAHLGSAAAQRLRLNGPPAFSGSNPNTATPVGAPT